MVGFSLIFIALGASATAIGSFLLDRLSLFSKIAAVLVIVLGLHMIGVFRLGFLQGERKIEVRKSEVVVIGGPQAMAAETPSS